MLDVELVPGDCEPLIADTFGGSRLVKSRFREKARVGKWRILLIVAVLLLGILLTIIYYWEEENYYNTYRIPVDKILNYKPETTVTFDELLQENFEFNIKGYDVMVFLHIQKTGGTTFGKHLVQDLDLERECECHRGTRKKKKKLRCDCFRPGKGEKNWLFSRYSTGWKCGLHPDWTELNSCVDTYLKGLEDDEHQRRYFYISMLREPVDRFLSEFRHVQRGATWKTATNMCGGRSWADLIPKCYEGEEDWSDVTLDEFISCEHNLAINRQTRMLSDLELVGCYNMSAMPVEQRNRIMLESAKANLNKLAYFGVTEEQKISQYLFEETFNLEFLTVFEQYNSTHSSNTRARLGERRLARIQSLNHLDIELYHFASQLLKQRFEKMKSLDTVYDEHIARFGMENNNKDNNKLELGWQTLEDEEY